jgi:hypothetical protein
MRRVQTKQTFKLRLLTFVLALALVWYSLNPVPGPLLRQDDEPPDEKKRNLEPHSMPAALPVAFKQLVEKAEPLLPSDEDDDDFEWPEFIDG